MQERLGWSTRLVLLLFAVASSGAAALPARAADAAPEAARLFDPLQVREENALGTFNQGLGVAGIHLLDVDGDGTPEILVGHPMMWYVLQHDPARHGFVQRHFHEHFLGSPFGVGDIIEVEPGDVDGNGSPEVVVLYDDGSYDVFDAASGELQLSATTSVLAPSALAVGNVDGFGADEIVIYDGDLLAVLRAGIPISLWELNASGGTDLAIGNVDADPAGEIVLSNGSVVDGAARAIQWSYPGGFGQWIGLGDVDGDGIDEIAGADGWSALRCVSAVSQQPLWVSSSSDNDAIALGDVDGDGLAEVLLGDGQWGSVRVIDGQSGVERSLLDNPEHGVAAVAAGDVDGDCQVEVLWGAGYASTGRDRLYVGNPAGPGIEWENVEADGPISALTVADLDGDGRREVLWVSSESDAGYRDAILMVDDLHQRQNRYRSPLPIRWETTGVAVAPLDGDPALEYVLGQVDDRLARAYDGATHAPQWSALPSGSEYVSAVATGDVDGDGASEVLVATGGSSGPSHVRLLKGVDGSLLWQSILLTPVGGAIHELRVADVDGDGATEFLWVKENDGIRVYSGSSRSEEWFQALAAARSLDVADVDGDLDLDIVVGSRTGEIRAWDGASHAPLFASSVGTGSINALRVVDLDGDGAVEIVLAAEVDTRSSLALVLAAASRVELWRSPPLAGKAGLGSGLVVADADDDGELEIAVSTSYAVRIFEYEGAAGDTAAPTWPWTVGARTARAIPSATCCPAIDLNWSGALDGASPPVEYNVYRGTTGGFSPDPANLVVRTGQLSYRDAGLASDTRYFYVVRAVDRRGNEDANTNEVSATTADATPPLAPAIVSIDDPNPCDLSGVDVRFSYSAPTTDIRFDLIVDGVSRAIDIGSPFRFRPGDTARHSYAVQAVSITCSSVSVGAALDAEDRGQPQNLPEILSFVDNDVCLTSGVTLSFAHPSPPPGSRFDLLLDGSVIATWVTSPLLFTPPDSQPHAYVVRLVDPSCPGGVDSASWTRADGNRIPPAATAVAITDADACAESAANLRFSHAGFVASGHLELWRDGRLFLSPVIDGTLFTPGDTLPHRYRVRAVDDACVLMTDSAEITYADGTCPTLGEPRIFLARGVTADELRVGWDAATGPVATYNLYPGTLAALRTTGSYDHAKALAGATFPDSPTPGDGCDFAGGAGTSARIQTPPGGDFYFLLVSADASGREGPYGRSWDGVRDIHDPGIDPRPASFFCP